MYFPYFRGKQYELLTIRETAPILADSNFVPIIEPVKQALSGLQRTVEALCEVGCDAVIIVNPTYGDHASAGEGITTLLGTHFASDDSISAGILLRDTTTVAQVLALCERHRGHPLTLIHAGFTNPKELVEKVSGIETMRHVFVEPCGKLYRKHFLAGSRVLVRDGFQARKNSDYPAMEPFSDLHATFAEEGMTGFGDFLIAGDKFSEGGGPAYAVAIHITFIDEDQDDAMFIYHFKSIRQNTPIDPAGKFAEALNALIKKLDSGNSKIFESQAIGEFRALHREKHFPGLGYVKKLSLKHHIETMANYFG